MHVFLYEICASTAMAGYTRTGSKRTVHVCSEMTESGVSIGGGFCLAPGQIKLAIKIITTLT